MYTMCVVVLPKSFQLLSKINGIPEEFLVDVFATNGSNQPLDEGMRLWRIRERLDFVYTKYPHVCLPLVIKE